MPDSFDPPRTVVFTTATTEAYGSTRVLLRHARALGDAGFDVVVAVPAAAGGFDGDALPSVDIVPVRGLRSWRAVLPSSPAAVAVGELGPDILVSTQIRDAVITALLARRLGVPYVALVQNHPRFAGNILVANAKRVAYRWALRSADRIVCVADHVAEICARDLGVQPDRIGVVANVIEPGVSEPAAPGAPAEIRRSLGVTDDAFMIVNVGRMHRQKGQEDLIDALAIVADESTVAVFVGDVEASKSSTYHAGLRDRVAAAGLEAGVRWAGFRTDVPAILRAGDLFVSSSRWEAGPSLAVLEAMAGQCAVLLTDHGERLDGFVDEVHGLYVPSGDPAALARGLRWMKERTDDERRAMGVQARRLVEERHAQLTASGGMLEQLGLALAARR